MALGRLLRERGTGWVDMAFIDAGKANCPRCYEDCLALVGPGGLIAVGSTLFFGRVIDPQARDADTGAIRRLQRSDPGRSARRCVGVAGGRRSGAGSRALVRRPG
ncbi:MULTISPECIES: hypothetical protein [Streptomyces]|uniref:hypothetical protein n=1 Tax=Streptomyces TaxID=1883 RepID=UPI0031CFE1C2